MPIDVSILNPPQRAAVVHGDGPLLVLAGAGSGKTRVITYRVARLLERGVLPRAICALSFTNKAAGEMRERVAALVGKWQTEQLTLSTFHSLGLMILKAEKAALGFPRGFTIYDQADQLGVIREILRDVKIDDRKFDPKAIAFRISRAKNAFVSAEEYVDADGDYDAITKLVYPRYMAAMKGFAAVDFDDLITETVRLIERDPEVRERWQERYWYLLVDEYQDTNRAQLRLVRALAEKRNNVTVVGDDDQSIYGWRGAEAENILEFEKHFPGAQVIKLEQNYRSTPIILEAANAVIRNNAARRDKTLFSDKHRGQKIQVVVCPDAEAEAKFVCDEIERMRLEEHRKYADCAVLYRSNVQARPLEEMLLSRRIPFEMVGGQEFYERKEIKDVMAYLKLALFPRDEIAVRRVINYPARGIGQATLDRAAQWALAHHVPLLEAFLRFDEIPDTTPATRSAVAGFAEIVKDFSAKLQAATNVVPVVEELVEKIALFDDIRAAATSASAAARRVDNVKEFFKSVENHQQKKPGLERLGHYLQALSLRANDDDDENGGGDRVRLMTLHGAKGLEWPAVFLVGMEEELLPHARTLYPSGPDIAGDADVSEERRLAYVGITRARERLYLSRALERRKHGKERNRTPSRFLAEIPEELLEKRDLIQEAQLPVSQAEMQNFWSSLLKV